MSRSGITRRVGLCPFKFGDVVRAKDDPRHAGKVIHAYAGLVDISWVETGWLSLAVLASTLETVPLEDR